MVRGDNYLPQKLYSKSPFLTIILSIIFGVLIVTTGVSAATTISTNIVTAGTLTVSGASSLAAVTTSGTLTVGSSGTALTQIIKGTCTSFNGSGAASIDASHAASTTKPYDCAVTGVVSGDVVLAQFATSTNSTTPGDAWAVVGAKASTTPGYITVLITNFGLSRVPSATGVGSSTSYIIIR